jgi:hypothetical protein
MGCDEQLAEAQAAVAGRHLRVGKDGASGPDEPGFESVGQDGVEKDAAAEADMIQAGALDDAERRLG